MVIEERNTNYGTIFSIWDRFLGTLLADVVQSGIRIGVGAYQKPDRLKFHHLEMEIDGKRIEGKYCFVEVCNSRYTGGRMLMAPQARIDDGWFDLNGKWDPDPAKFPAMIEEHRRLVESG